MHWNIQGEADRFGSKEEALLFAPAIAALLTLIFVFLPLFDPRRANIAASYKFWNATAIGAVALLAYIHVLMVLAALGRPIDITGYLVPALALLFIVIGNYISKTRSNFFAGVRTPWTLSSDYSWNKTHRLAGLLFVGAGLAGLVASFAIGGPIALVVLIGCVLAAALIPVVASYFYWRADPSRGSS
jgi:uncharacterized membrane protein